MNVRAFIAILIVSPFLLALGGCGGGSGGGGGGAATVVGRAVDDGTQAALGGATVRIGNASAQTGNDGFFTVANAPTGDQMLTINAGGHDTFLLAVDLAGGQNNVGVCYVAPTLQVGRGAVTGRMLLAGGTGVNGGTVRSDGASAVSRSDGTGRFTLYNLPAGTTQVTFSDPTSGSSAWEYVTVQSARVTDMGQVFLSFGPPPPPL